MGIIGNCRSRTTAQSMNFFRLSLFSLLVSTAQAFPVSESNVDVDMGGNSTGNGTNTAQIALDVTRGILLGMGEQSVDGLSECVADLEGTFTDMEQAFVDFEGGTVKSVLDGIDEISDAVDGAVNAFKQFKNPVEYAVQVGKSVLVNGKDIYTEISTAAADWKAQDYEAAGEQIGKAVAQVFVPPPPEEELDFVQSTAPTADLAPLALVVSNNTNPAVDALEMIGGVFLGFAKKEFDDFQDCIAAPEQIFEDLKDALADFKGGTASSVMDGMKQVGNALKTVVSGLKDCKSTWGEIGDFVDAIESFSNPASFALHVGKNILVNGKDIHGGITAAIDAFEAEQYEPCGEAIGKILADMLMPGR